MVVLLMDSNRVSSLHVTLYKQLRKGLISLS